MYSIFTVALLATLTSNALAGPVRSRDVPLGQVVTYCTSPNTIALTFDDGPSGYTPQLLDLLAEYGARATFFLTGDASRQYPDVIKRMRREGHQVASHTYDHANLPSLNHDQIVSQMNRLEDVLIPLMGDVPAYMRPPYFETNDLVLQTMRELGYKVIQASIDTKDYLNNDPARIDDSYQKFVNELNAGGNIVLAHDIHEQTVVTLARKMLDESKARGLALTTVGDCLGEDPSKWYYGV
ncbi:polysaccharide deacetylase family protein [Aspergillus avenaceus]|uniref:Polysaccharide deacetylase family protein n=1 Tax=Aspergillus avenaceus TaxID=36643 RepID=A0A5N6TKP3_ASPAV|nr:polysaccharide deacetylase family protein [Aspergillus avenaceus]